MRVINFEQNQGTFVARSTGVREARGKYVLFLDADDELESDEVAQILFK